MTWNRIRFAQAPTGILRWQAPQTPLHNRSEVIVASSFGPQCPQGQVAPATPFNETVSLGNEDCLFLNVYAPANATGLPVFVYIRESETVCHMWDEAERSRWRRLCPAQWPKRSHVAHADQSEWLCISNDPISSEL